MKTRWIARTRRGRAALLAASGVFVVACAPAPHTPGALPVAVRSSTGASEHPAMRVVEGGGPLAGGVALERDGIARSTSALVVASGGVRRLFVGLEKTNTLAGHRSSPPFEPENLERSRLGYAYSDDEGSSWTRQPVPVTQLASFGFDSLVGAPAVAAYPTLPLSRSEPPAQDSMVYLVGLAGGESAGHDGGSFRSLVIARSPDGGTRFGALYPFPPTGLLGGMPSSPSVTVDEGGLVHVAYLIDAGTERARVAYTRGGWGTRGGSAPSPEFRQVNTLGLGLAERERAQLRRVIVRAGDGPRYMAVERVEPLAVERVTRDHDARLRLVLLRERPLEEGLAWDVVELDGHEGREVLVRAVREGEGRGPAAGGIDFQRVRTRNSPAAVTAEAGSMGPSHLVWAGHDAGDEGGADHVYYQAFTSRLVGAAGYTEDFGPRVRLDEAGSGERAAQPVAHADGNELFVSWQQYDPRRSEAAVRRMVRRSTDYGRSWEPVREIAE